ncbi:MAG: hypothetical protein Q8R85_21930 [Bosea sp. (in: a-proteobacteria)]|uniref:hypothetical protein n=1 Tax=Bosea sp. (in: a-proteobacteria) TaxID=1871050 RepID=UPI002735550A|nr:hypothetical protein [Bosea sp. (in: a-proteobacteria)]MDP3603824.1 hypothetical protein [Bosea sp. (in: a-proteobacteria)]
MFRRSIMTLGALAASAFAVHAQPSYLNFKSMQPLVSAYAKCWQMNEQLQTINARYNCREVIAPRLHTLAKGKKISNRDFDYAVKYLENIMFRDMYDHATKIGFPWNEKFPDAENMSNACVEELTDSEESKATIYNVIDCINRPSRKNLSAAWKFINETQSAWSAKADSYNDQFMFECMKEKFGINDNMMNVVTQCLLHVDKNVQKLSADRTFELLLRSYEVTFTWLKNKGEVKFNAPDIAKLFCDGEQVKKLDCMLAGTTAIMDFAIKKAKADNALDSFKQVF